jgi:hypothetical protein
MARSESMMPDLDEADLVGIYRDSAPSNMLGSVSLPFTAAPPSHRPASSAPRILTSDIANRPQSACLKDNKSPEGVASRESAVDAAHRVSLFLQDLESIQPPRKKRRMTPVFAPSPSPSLTPRSEPTKGEENVRLETLLAPEPAHNSNTASEAPSRKLKSAFNPQSERPSIIKVEDEAATPLPHSYVVPAGRPPADGCVPKTSPDDDDRMRSMDLESPPTSPRRFEEPRHLPPRLGRPSSSSASSSSEQSVNVRMENAKSEIRNLLRQVQEHRGIAERCAVLESEKEAALERAEHATKELERSVALREAAQAELERERRDHQDTRTRLGKEAAEARAAQRGAAQVLQRALDEAQAAVCEERGLRDVAMANARIALERSDAAESALEAERARRGEAQSALETERRLRLFAEASLHDLRRESTTPFVVPALLEALGDVSRMTSEALGDAALVQSTPSNTNPKLSWI